MMKHHVRIEPIGLEEEVEHLTPLRDVVAKHGVEFPCSGKGRCGNCKVKLLKGNIEIDNKQKTLLEQKHLDNKDWRIACLSTVTEDITLYIEPRGKEVIQTDYSFFKFQPEKGYGIAIDLGSTTIVSQLINLQTNQIEDTTMTINSQTFYGADIISRLSYAMKSTTHLKQLSNLVRDDIRTQIRTFDDNKRQKTRKVVIVGNSVMHNLFGCINITNLATYPFQSPNNAELEFYADELEFPLPPTCKVRFLPNMGHFVGSDILAGIQAIKMQKQEKYQLLIDLGTNGEIALGNKYNIHYASTAAGPAFEGINISQGMRASSGAIYRIDSSGYKTINNTKAKGICGSGLIDSIYLLLKEKKIDNTGAIIESNCHRLPLTEDIYLTDKDIREFQLAKGAISAGIQILLDEANITISEVEHVYLSGGLGNYVDEDKAIRIGLLDGMKKSQILKMNNSALMGAKENLFENNNTDMKIILALAKHCSLETNTKFQDIYCEKLFFPNKIPNDNNI